MGVAAGRGALRGTGELRDREASVRAAALQVAVLLEDRRDEDVSVGEVAGVWRGLPLVEGEGALRQGERAAELAGLAERVGAVVEIVGLALVIVAEQLVEQRLGAVVVGEGRAEIAASREHVAEVGVRVDAQEAGFAA